MDYSDFSRNGKVKDRRVLVTGASGFHGSWLAEHLVNQGASVTAILADWNPDARFWSDGIIDRVDNIVVGDIREYRLVERAISDHSIDSVFHLAAIAVEKAAFQSPLTAFEVNIRGTYNILEVCRQHGVSRVVVATSDKVYGDSPVLPYTEDLPLLGRHPYDGSKVCQDVLAQTYHRSFGLPVAIGRFGNVYGGGDLAWSRLIPGSLLRMFNGKPAELRVPASGQEFKRDFLYIKDLVGAYMAMWRGLARPEVCGEAFNFAVGGQWSPREIIEKLQRLTGLDIPPNITVSDHMEIKSQQVSAEKARQLLGWKPRYSLDAGLSETAKWYTDYLVGPRLSAIEELEPALAPGVNGKLPKTRTQIHIPARQSRNRLVKKARSLLSQPVRRGDKGISIPNVADIRVGRFTRFLGHANG